MVKPYPPGRRTTRQKKRDRREFRRLARLRATAPVAEIGYWQKWARNG